MVGLVEEFEEAMYSPTKRREYAADAKELVEFFEVSPTYEALLRGEMRQQEMVDEMLAKKQKEEQDQDQEKQGTEKGAKPALKGASEGDGKGSGGAVEGAGDDVAAAALAKLSL